MADCQEAIAAALSVFGIPSWSSASEGERVFYLRAAAVAMDAARAAVEALPRGLHFVSRADVLELLTPKGERPAAPPGVESP